MFSVLADLEVARVNLIVAVLIWVMIYPMMVNVDLMSLRHIGDRPKGLVLTVVVNWLVKPFTSDPGPFSSGSDMREPGEDFAMLFAFSKTWLCAGKCKANQDIFDPLGVPLASETQLAPDVAVMESSGRNSSAMALESEREA